MKDNRQMTKKQLKVLANNIGAKSIANNIYAYENDINDLIRAYHKLGITARNELIAYSAGIYGNNGRIDMIILNSECIVKGVKEFYICWY